MQSKAERTPSTPHIMNITQVPIVKLHHLLMWPLSFHLYLHLCSFPILLKQIPKQNPKYLKDNLDVLKIFTIIKNLLYSTGNPTQYCVMTYMGRESKKRVDICIWLTDSPCHTLETNTTLQINYTLTKILKNFTILLKHLKIVKLFFSLRHIVSVQIFFFVYDFSTVYFSLSYNWQTTLVSSIKHNISVFVYISKWSQ